MNINNLFIHLENKNIPYKKINYGYNYFYNAPALEYTAAGIELIYNNIKELNTVKNHIEKYCHRYNFDIFHVGRLSCDIYGYYHFYMVVRTAADRDASVLYYSFADPAKNEIENIIHNYHLRGIYYSFHCLLNKTLIDVMNSYGAKYNDALKAATKKATLIAA